MIPDFNIEELDNVWIEGINPDDYPDFVDAFIASADYMGHELSDDVCEWITDNYPEIVQELAFYQML